MMPRLPPRFLFAMLLPAMLAACTSTPNEFMRAPALSPVGSGLTPSESEQEANIPLSVHSHGSGYGASTDLYSDQRIAHVGDIVTVIISMNDKATFGNSTDRSLQAKTGFLMDFGFTPPTTGTSSSSGSPGKLLADVNSSSSTQGQGNIDRAEQIQVSVPAVVTRVLPNGNLVIRGSQEVRVNYELRQITMAGIVRPDDISRNNTIAYDHVAEARISYGGRGRLTDVQQPAWGQQIYDSVKPF